MKTTNINFWKRLSLSHKISSIGSIGLIFSLYLNWFSDIDVFRSGDSYTGLNGPLYFVGINIFILAVANLVMCFGKAFNLAVFKKLTLSQLGKYQMMGGFGTMYLLMIVNSVYFSSQFGLNILSKKSEIGVMVAMIAAVVICASGYMNYRRKFELGMENEGEMVANAKDEVEIVNSEKSENDSMARGFGGGLKKSPKQVSDEITTRQDQPIKSVQGQNIEISKQTEQESVSIYSDRDLRGKTDYDRARMYENLKKVMMKDTLSPDQRRKEREKQGKDNAFSSNFGASKVAANGVKPKNVGNADDLLKQSQYKKAGIVDSEGGIAAKKTQMYRMDL